VAVSVAKGTSAGRRLGGGWIVLWLVFVGALGVGTYALAEVGLHVRRQQVAARIEAPPEEDPRFVGDALLRRANRPGYASVSAAPDGSPRRYTINALGFRGPPTSSEKAPGTIRVIAVGGSTVYGALSDDSETLPMQLEAALRRQLGPRVEVINAGVPGFYALSEAIYVKRDLLTLSPDAIVVLDGLNDVFYGVNEEWPAQMAEDQLHLMHDGRFPELVSAIDQTMFPDGLVEHQVSMLVHSLRLRLDAPERGAVASDRVVNLHAASLGMLTGYAQHESAAVPVVVALQPLMPTGAKTLAPQEQQALDAGGNWELAYWEAAAREMYPMMVSTTRTAVERSGGRFLDLRAAFDTEPGAAYAEDAVHYSALGNRILADALASEIIDELPASR
jgi:lysophospholipase L1-like esterase